MTNYYCLVAGLPDLSLEDGKLNYTVANFKSEIYSELSEKDRKLIWRSSIRRRLLTTYIPVETVER